MCGLIFCVLKKNFNSFYEQSCSDLKGGSPAVSSPLETEITSQVCREGVTLLFLLHWLSLNERGTEV